MTSNLLYPLLHAIIISLGSMVMGIHTAFFSPAQSSLVPEFNLSDSNASLFNSLIFLFAALGSIIFKISVRFVGRKMTLYIFAFVTIIFTILQAVSKTTFLIFFSRCFLGIVTGLFAALCPLYIVEISPPEYRGALGVLQLLFAVLGNIYVYLFGIGFNWRIITWFTLIIPCLLASLLWIVPNSHVKETSEMAESIFQMKFLIPFIHSVILIFFQQFAGYNAVISNYTAIFRDAKVPIKPEIATVIVPIATLISCVFSSFSVEIFGRKPSWIVSSFGHVIAVSIIWATDIFNLPKILPIIALFISNLSIGIGVGPIPWMIVAELFPDSVKSIFQSIIITINWLFATVVVYLWGIMKNWSMGWSFFIFACITLLSAIYGILWMPETKAKIEPATPSADSKENVSA
jgi:MFS family permease